MSVSLPIRRRGASAAAILLLALCGAAAAQPPALDLDTALTLAAERAPLLRAEAAAARAAHERAVAAGQRPDPVLRFGVEGLPIEGPNRFSTSADFMTSRNVGLMQQFTRADKLRARAATEQADAAVARARRDMRLAELRRDTALAWLERHDLERQRALLQQQRDEAALQVEAADAAYRGGRGAQADLFSARTQVAAIEDRLADADARIEQAQIALERWIGAGPAARAPLGARPDPARLAQPVGHLEHELDALPELVARRRAVERAEAEAAVARAERRHDWSAEVGFAQRGSQYSNMVSLTLSTPLALDRGQRQDRELAARLAEVERLQAERDDALREHAAQLRGWLRDWRSALERGAHHETRLIPLAAERTQAALAAYRAGSGALAAVLDARGAEIDARIERLQLDMQAARGWARLNHLTIPGPEATR